MNRLITRINKLERLVHVGPEAELRGLSDEELERRLDELLMRVSEEDIRAMAREHNEFYTPERLEATLARWRRLCQNIEDKRDLQERGERVPGARDGDANITVG